MTMKSLRFAFVALLALVLTSACEKNPITGPTPPPQGGVPGNPYNDPIHSVSSVELRWTVSGAGAVVNGNTVSGAGEQSDFYARVDLPSAPATYNLVVGDVVGQTANTIGQNEAIFFSYPMVSLIPNIRSGERYQLRIMVLKNGQPTMMRVNGQSPMVAEVDLTVEVR